MAICVLCYLLNVHCLCILLIDCQFLGDIEYQSSVMKVSSSIEDKEKMTDVKLENVLHNQERFNSFSPEMPVLSSSTSTSSISSLGSSELAKMCSTRLQLPKEKNNQQNSNGNLSKSIYLVVSTQREDSGIFASDDTSTSEFSQSPSPELLISSGEHSSKVSNSIINLH